MKKIYCLILLTLVICISVCGQVNTGADQINKYLPVIKKLRVAIVANQTSKIKNVHLLDTLLCRGVNIRKIFSPEHGFRGNIDAGKKIADGKDLKTGLPIISLYGKHKKPTNKDLSGIDVVIFDIQDVGVRFYTYISTLHYVMEACADNNVKLIVLDRPNPNAFYIDGPVLDTKHKSFVGMHPVPVVYGMTIGEYAEMINGENWINSDNKADLKVVKLMNWNHDTKYILPVKPSPNLPNRESILLYPSLCFFEGTVVSAGRGTDYPFQVFGMPNMAKGDFSFTPRSIEGASRYPKYKGLKCMGVDLRGEGVCVLNTKQLNLNYLIFAYKNVFNKNKFFNSFFEKLAGTDNLRRQIIGGVSVRDIRESWQDDIAKFKIIRAKYLLYK